MIPSSTSPSANRSAPPSLLDPIAHTTNNSRLSQLEEENVQLRAERHRLITQCNARVETHLAEIRRLKAQVDPKNLPTSAGEIESLRAENRELTRLCLYLDQQRQWIFGQLLNALQSNSNSSSNKAGVDNHLVEHIERLERRVKQLEVVGGGESSPSASGYSRPLLVDGTQQTSIYLTSSGAMLDMLKSKSEVLTTATNEGTDGEGTVYCSSTASTSTGEDCCVGGEMGSAFSILVNSYHEGLAAITQSQSQQPCLEVRPLGTIEEEDPTLTVGAIKEKVMERTRKQPFTYSALLTASINSAGESDNRMSSCSSSSGVSSNSTWSGLSPATTTVKSSTRSSLATIEDDDDSGGGKEDLPPRMPPLTSTSIFYPLGSLLGGDGDEFNGDNGGNDLGAGLSNGRLRVPQLRTNSKRAKPRIIVEPGGGGVQAAKLERIRLCEEDYKCVGEKDERRGTAGNIGKERFTNQIAIEANVITL